MTNELLTTKEVLELTGLKLSQLQYLRNNGVIPSIRRRACYPTLYPPEAVEIIKARLEKLQVVQ